MPSLSKFAAISLVVCPKGIGSHLGRVRPINLDHRVNQKSHAEQQDKYHDPFNHGEPAH